MIMAQFTLTYTDIVNPHTNLPIKSVVGARDDRPDFIYVLDKAPYRWRKYPKFPVSAAKVGPSDWTGQEHDLGQALEELHLLSDRNYSQIRLRFFLAQSIMRGIVAHFHQGIIPPMFDPDVEND